MCVDLSTSTIKGGAAVARLRDQTVKKNPEDDWRNKFRVRDLILALNIMEVIRLGAASESRRSTEPPKFNYSWRKLKEKLVELFGGEVAVIWSGEGHHSAVAMELYPYDLRVYHICLRANSGVLADVVFDVDFLLKSQNLWPNGHLKSSNKRRFLYDLLLAIDMDDLTEAMIR